MTRSYALLAGGLLILGLTLVGMARLHRAEPVRPSPAPATRVEAVRITIGAAGVEPSLVVIPLHARVRLVAVNRGVHAAGLTLAGYEDRVPAATLAPGDSTSREFVADRPGEDFPWLVDGRPRGRVIVSGSHLVEGHR